MKKVILLAGLVLSSGIQGIYAMNPQAGATAEDLQREYLRRMQEMARQFQEALQREREVHAQEMAAEREKLSEAKKARDQSEREKVLRGILLHINVEDKTPIRITADDVLQLSILERHSKTDEIYQRFLPYGELFGRTDLGVEATDEDLGVVFNYIKATEVSPEPAPLTLIRDPHSGPKWWNTYVSNADMVFLMRKYGMLDVAWNYPGTDWGEVHTAWAYGNTASNVAQFNHFKDLENTERRRIHSDALAKRANELKLAEETPFPSDEFNRLVNQVNRFLAEGTQDTL